MFSINRYLEDIGWLSQWPFTVIVGNLFSCHALSANPNTTDSSHWRHNDYDGVSNHQPHGCLLNRLFRRRSKRTSKLSVTGLCVGNSPGPVNSPRKGPVTRKIFPFDAVIMLIGNLGMGDGRGAHIDVFKVRIMLKEYIYISDTTYVWISRIEICFSLCHKLSYVIHLSF